MTKKIFKYGLITLLVAIILLAFTNPSIKQFKDYIGENSKGHYIMTFKRTSNYLIYSTYQFSFYTNDLDEEDMSSERDTHLRNISGYYTGFFLNFYKK